MNIRIKIFLVIKCFLHPLCISYSVLIHNMSVDLCYHICPGMSRISLNSFYISYKHNFS